MASNFRFTTVSKEGRNLDVLVDKDLQSLVQVQVDRKGQKLLAITKDGTEIRNYGLNMVSDFLFIFFR